jgi:hypothetical protein
MAGSSVPNPSFATVVLAALAGSLAACEVLLGLGDFRRVSCAFDCDAGESGFAPGLDASVPDADDAEAEAAADAGDASPAPVANVTDATPPEATAHEIWAHWPMPNPDAAIAPDSAVPLPNPMTYDAGQEGGTLDWQTKLLWETDGAQVASTYLEAWGHCSSLGPGWRVPTRIELVSLVDFTRYSPSIDEPPFARTQMMKPYWTSSVVWAPDAGADAAVNYWTVWFNDGLVYPDHAGGYVRCVNGGMP